MKLSKENVKRFRDELINNDALKKELLDFNPSTLEDLVSFAAEKGFIFTVDEIKETKEEMKKISDDELAQVAAGTFGPEHRVSNAHLVLDVFRLVSHYPPL